MAFLKRTFTINMDKIFYREKSREMFQFMVTNANVEDMSNGLPDQIVRILT